MTGIRIVTTGPLLPPRRGPSFKVRPRSSVLRLDDGLLPRTQCHERKVAILAQDGGIDTALT
jgi:hypothetical protein